MAFGPNRESLIGDLTEQYQRGRSTIWYWRQVLAAIFGGAARGIRGRKRLATGSLVLTLFAVVGPVLGAWVAVIAMVGALVAMAIHAWYGRHPSDLPMPSDPQRRSPQINFSSTEVAGNIGGLIFVVGSVFIVVLGLPSVVWFLLAGTVAGCILAWGLIAWHTRHPQYGLPANRIVWR